MSAFLCPCGCKKEVPNGRYWATPTCGEKAKKFGMYMPQGGEVRKHERMIKRFGKGRK